MERIWSETKTKNLRNLLSLIFKLLTVYVRERFQK